jgi:hypothetical protein
VSYSDDYKDMQHAKFLDQWAPDDRLPELTAENLRYNIARANKAESELREIRIAVSDIKRVLNL